MRNKYALAIGGLIIVVTAGTMAYAKQASDHENDALADLAKAQVSITQAIAAAEQAASGKATRAELENEKNTLFYKVEVANAGTKKIMDVHVDASSGKVLSTKKDRGDSGKDEQDDD
jgi:uncharacterized membrane protein YkoI